MQERAKYTSTVHLSYTAKVAAMSGTIIAVQKGCLTVTPFQPGQSMSTLST